MRLCLCNCTQTFKSSSLSPSERQYIILVSQEGEWGIFPTVLSSRHFRIYVDTSGWGYLLSWSVDYDIPCVYINLTPHHFPLFITSSYYCSSFSPVSNSNVSSPGWPASWQNAFCSAWSDGSQPSQVILNPHREYLIVQSKTVLSSMFNSCKTNFWPTCIFAVKIYTGC